MPLYIEKERTYEQALKTVPDRTARPRHTVSPGTRWKDFAQPAKQYTVHHMRPAPPSNVMWQAPPNAAPDPFRRKAMPRLPRFWKALPLLSIIPVVEFVDDFEFYKDPNPFAPKSGDWYFVGGCGRLPGAPPYAPDNDGPFWEFVSGHVNNCSSGQVPAALTNRADIYTPKVRNLANANWTMFVSDSRLTPARRMRHDQVWWRDDTGTGTFDTDLNNQPVQPALQPALDPNVVRRMDPDEDLAPKPVIQPQEAPQPAVPNWHWTEAPTKPRPNQWTRPRPRQRETKVLSRTARMGIFLWKLMDNVSELTEIAAAFYKALPKSVRDRWDCGSGVNIGQYGSDVNACMLKALWHNYNKIDPDTAFMNVAKNVAEDMTIGQFHKLLGQLLPPGVSIEKTAVTTALAPWQVEAYIAEKLAEVFDLVGIK